MAETSSLAGSIPKNDADELPQKPASRDYGSLPSTIYSVNTIDVQHPHPTDLRVQVLLPGPFELDKVLSGDAARFMRIALSDTRDDKRDGSSGTLSVEVLVESSTSKASSLSSDKSEDTEGE